MNAQKFQEEILNNAVQMDASVNFQLNGSDQLFAAKYLTYMPSREVLRREIEQQKEFFLLQHKRD